ncbi:uncharacterized protein LOC134095598 [Sardina pilchardus]|uniref:uncharacterized protein LOC134095598 n=1 Tax=Sardina pilchardus TaxID=27697 RepID=UPI002E141971
MFWLLLLIGALPISDGLKVFEFCSGKKFNIPAPIMSRVPLLAGIYFTPITTTTPGAKMLMVMNRTQSLDPHYQYKDETIFISELTDRDQGTFSWSHHDSTQLNDFLKLVLKDCSEHMNVYYGDTIEIFPPRRAVVLEFSSSRTPSVPQVVWRRGRTGQVKDRWSINTATPYHEGNYTARTHSGVELRKTQVTVIARTLQAIIGEEKSLTYLLPIPAGTASIRFTDRSGMEHVLYQEGRESLDTFHLFNGRFSLQNQPLGSKIQIRDVRSGDAGTYKVRDINGSLVISAELESMTIAASEKTPPRFPDVEHEHEHEHEQYDEDEAYENPPSFHYLHLTLGLMLFIFFVLCCCVCKCCCRRSSRTAKVPSTLDHSPPPYNECLPPVPRSALIDDFTHRPPALDTQLLSTSQCPFASNLSPELDAGPCFQPKRKLGDSLDFLSTNPLSTDTLPAATYTSAKLSFL